MNMHWLDDGELLLVTGTDDPAVARLWIEQNGEPEMLDFIDEVGGEGEARRGNIVPAPPSTRECDGYSWFWRTNPKGRIKAVVFG